MLRFASSPPSFEENSLHTEAAGSAPPDAFGPFRVLHQIGAGALGPVFRAYDSEQAKLVAVKLFRIDLSPERVHQLVAELELLIAADLSHPGIAAPIGTGIAGVAAYLAQDFVAADSLDSVIREHGAAPARETLRIVAQIAGALDSAASAGIFHGSLHPRDVLISSDDARITGLGVTQALARVGFATQLRRPYTAPERSTAGRWDRRADVFSLAALAHELLWAKRITGTGSEAAGAVTAIGGGDVDALRELFARALADDPADRFETSGEFARALEAALMEVSRLPTMAFLPLDDEEAEDTVTTPPPGPPAGPDDDDAVPDTPAPTLLMNPARADPSIGTDTAPSSVWPIALALFVGIALGFSGGYWLGNVQQATEPQLAVAEAPPKPAATVAAEQPPSATETEVQLAREKSIARVEPAPATVVRAKSAATTGRISVRSTPPGARVTVNGREAGKTPVTIRQLGRGVHTVRVSRDGYRTEERRVPVTAAQPNRSVSVQLPRAAARAPAPPRAPTISAPAVNQTTSLVVESRPSGAAVIVNGKRVGTTPISIGEFTSGTHAVRLELDGYKPWTASVRVIAGEKNRVAASLER
jgi:protein kinase-like protein/PEGA domain-containing protein